MMIRGVGDRWLAGELPDGIAFELHAPVEIVGGKLDGRSGIVLLLMSTGADPAYLVRLRPLSDDVRVRQSELRRLPVSP